MLKLWQIFKAFLKKVTNGLIQLEQINLLFFQIMLVFQMMHMQQDGMHQQLFQQKMQFTIKLKHLHQLIILYLQEQLNCQFTQLEHCQQDHKEKQQL